MVLVLVDLYGRTSTRMVEKNLETQRIHMNQFMKLLKTRGQFFFRKSLRIFLYLSHRFTTTTVI